MAQALFAMMDTFEIGGFIILTMFPEGNVLSWMVVDWVRMWRGTGHEQYRIMVGRKQPVLPSLANLIGMFSAENTF